MDKIPANVISGDWDTSNPKNFKALFEPNPIWTRFDTNFNLKAGLKRKSLHTDVRIDYDLDNGYSLTSLTAAHRDKTMTLIDLNYRSGKNEVNPFNATRPTAWVGHALEQR